MADGIEFHRCVGAIMARWSDYHTAGQRQIVTTIEYLVDEEDDTPDLRSPNALADDLRELHQLQEYLGYV